MIDILNRAYCPTLDEISECTHNPLFSIFCSEIQAKYRCKEKIEYSSCSWKPGWNVKFKKSGKNLCTLYPKDGYFTVLVVIGQAEKPTVEHIMCQCTPEIQEICHQTKEGNGQKWLMIDLEDRDNRYLDVIRLIGIRCGNYSDFPSL